MKYVFWQNILSIHQAPFLRSLSQTNEVILIVEEENDKKRVESGWNVPDFGKTEIIIQPNLDKINLILEKKDAVHVFSGINVFPLLKIVLGLAIEKKVKIGIMAEPFNRIGWKGKLRFLKYFLLKIKYKKHIQFFLATGNEGRRCYEKIGFNKKSIFDWGYFTEKQTISVNNDNLKQQEVSILFIGSIDKRKNILNLVDVFLALTTQSFKFTIIGKGALEDELNSKIMNCSSINYIRTVENNKIPSYIVNSDLLILPSIFDGWGAVVNEALMCGTPVISSNYCGSSILLDGKERGEVFSIEENNLGTVLIKWLQKGKVSDKQRSDIKKWADNNISGEVVANYFVEIISSVYNNTSSPKAPWLK